MDEPAGLGNDRRRDGDCRTCVVYCFRMEVFWTVRKPHENSSSASRSFPGMNRTVVLATLKRRLETKLTTLVVEIVTDRQWSRYR